MLPSGVFAHNRVDEVNWSEEPFDGLVLGKKHKLLISSLVTEHKSQSTSFDDLVAGKGRGLVGLLCGNPGCGKTLTAEAVAEKARKPLLTVSAGELGTYSWETDYKLKAILRRGERWGAVVLLDEADVFLQERDKTDVSRNALVSIFLTQVEYHPGILIFTTNLIKQIDSAFESTCYLRMLGVHGEVLTWNAGRSHPLLREVPRPRFQLAQDGLANVSSQSRRQREGDARTWSCSFGKTPAERTPGTLSSVDGDRLNW